MPLSDNSSRKGKKKPYTKPDMKRVELKPEEALAAGCKVDAATTASWDSNPCSLSVCAGLGS